MNTMQGRFLFVITVLTALSVQSVAAHPPFTDYIEQQISLLLSPNYIDVTVRFTFHQKEAAAARRQIDANQDKTLTQNEYVVFLERLVNQKNEIKLDLNGQQLKTVLLYDPACDDFGSRQINQTPLACEFSLFARVPELFASNSLRVENAFTPQTAVVCVLDAAAKSGLPIVEAVAADALQGPLPLRIASPDLKSASRVFTLTLSKDHFAGEKP